MAATTGYQAGVEANNTLLSYGVEAVWATKPAIQFQAIRYTSENLAITKQRQRPTEINLSREMSAAVTTQVSAGGVINVAFSYGVYDDFISSLLGSDWQTPVVLAGVAADIALTNTSSTTATLISTTAGKFTNLSAGQWIRLLGFTNAVNNGFYRIATKVSALSLILTTLAVTVTETPATTLAQVRASTIQNGKQFKSMWIEQQLSSILYLNYPGSYVTAMTLSAAVGQFFSGSFTVASQQELSATTEGSTGAVLAAPTGRVFDTVNGVAGIYLAELPIGATVDSFSLNIQNQSAAAEFGIGSSLGQGMLAGTLVVSGQFKCYFKDFTLYSRFAAETGGAIEFIVRDNTGAAYIITILNCVLSTVGIDSGSVGTAVFATFGLEGNPLTGSSGTIQIDKLPAS